MTYRAILVDPVSRTITALTLANDHKAVQAAIGARCLDTATIARDGRMHVLAVVDDSGLIQGLPCFRFDGYHHPLAGKAVLLGCDRAGETVDCPLDIEAVTARVRWLEAAHALAQTRADIAISAAQHRADGFNVETSADGLSNVITAGRE